MKTLIQKLLNWLRPTNRIVMVTEHFDDGLIECLYEVTPKGKGKLLRERGIPTQ